MRSDGGELMIEVCHCLGEWDKDRTRKTRDVIMILN